MTSVVSPPPFTAADERALRAPEVCERLSVSIPWLYEAIGKGSFPRPRKLGGASVWLLSEILEYLRTQPRAEITPRASIRETRAQRNARLAAAAAPAPAARRSRRATA